MNSRGILKVAVDNPSMSCGDKESDGARELGNLIPEKPCQGHGCGLIALVQGINDNDKRSIFRGWSATQGFEYKLSELFLECRGRDARSIVQNGRQDRTMGL